MHPSYILRAWGMNPVFNLDIKHALEDAEYPELRAPVYEQHIDPLPDKLHDLVHEALSAEYISVDIETFPGGGFSYIGFAFRRSCSAGVRCWHRLLRPLEPAVARQWRSWPT